MVFLKDWEPWMQKLVREVIGWLHSWDSNIDTAPRESRGDTRIGLIWHGRENRFNIVCFNRLKSHFRIELLLPLGLAHELEKELRDAGFDSRYTDSNKRLNVPLTPDGFEKKKNKSLLQRLVRTTYKQAIEPHPRDARSFGTRKYQFTVVVEQDEDGVYISSCPALQGCHSCGDTYEEAVGNLKDAIRLHIEARQSIGEPIPIEVAVDRVEVNVEAASRKTA